MGRGVFAGGIKFTPLPTPPPQGGREPALNGGGAQIYIIANRDVSLIPARSRHNHQLESVGVLEQIFQMENAIALLGAKVAAREQAAELSPAGAVARIGEHVRRAVAKNKTRARMIANLELVLALGEMRAHHAGDAVAVAQPHPEQCEPRGLCDQLLGMRAAPQEREIRRDGELDVTGHASLPEGEGRRAKLAGVGITHEGTPPAPRFARSRPPLKGREKASEWILMRTSRAGTKRARESRGRAPRGTA